MSKLGSQEGGRRIRDDSSTVSRGRRQSYSTHSQQGVCAWLIQLQKKYFPMNNEDAGDLGATSHGYGLGKVT